MTGQLAVSIIIPTHNRLEQLHTTLLALAAQHLPGSRMQVVVGLDGCTDGTREMLERMQSCSQMPYTLEWFEQDTQGPAATRNKAARMAAGEYLIFLDDDIEASPGLVAAHLETLRGGQRVSIGYLPPALSAPPGYFHDELRGWWEAMFDKMRDPSHRFAYTDLLSGNFALAKSLFHEAGAFDEGLLCHEDYELGYGLLKSGSEFIFSEKAWGIHHEKTALARSMERKVAEGTADHYIGDRHPELKASLLMSRLLQGRALELLVMVVGLFLPGPADRIVRAVQGSLLGFIENIRRYGLWRRGVTALMGYWYWRGVRRQLPTPWHVRAFLSNSVPESISPTFTLDLKEGLVAARERLDSYRPHQVRVYYGDRLVGDIPTLPGCEPLAGRHLDAQLLGRFRGKLLSILAEEDVPGSQSLHKMLSLSNEHDQVRPH